MDEGEYCESSHMAKSFLFLLQFLNINVNLKTCNVINFYKCSNNFDYIDINLSILIKLI